jgi:transcriptional regulator with XRE-family HTH domain
MANGRPRGPAIKGSGLRERRVQLGLRKTELAARCGVSARYIADLEKERYSPSIEALHRLAGVLEMPVTSLMRDPESDPITAGNAA